MEGNPNRSSAGMSSGLSPKQRAHWRALLVSAIVLGIAVRVWAALQWPANFQSDEAVFGLMARHILAGQFTPTLYGPAYLGSIESILAAGFMSLLGPSVMAFRLATVLLFAVFFVLHSIFTSRNFGQPVAFVSLLFLALPGFHVLNWTYQPIGTYGAMFVLGTALMLIGVPEIADPRRRTLRALAMGVLIGLGIWSNNTFVVYVAAVTLAAFVCSPEWRSIHAKLKTFAERTIQIPLAEMLPVIVLGVAGLGVLAFFSGGCRPEGLYQTIGSVSRVTLVVVGGAVAVYAATLSKRRAQLAIEGATLLGGFFLGYSPILYNWLAKGVPPYWAVYASCPTGAASHARLLAKEILPGLWGIPTVDQLKQIPAIPLIAWAIVILLVVAALACFVWWNRVTIWRTLTFSPPGPESKPVMMVSLTLALTILVSVLAENTVDIHSIRHMLVAVQASAVIFAVFLVRLAGRTRVVGTLIIAFWTLLVGLSNLTYANANWLIKFSRYDTQQVEVLERYLAENGVRYGYADYWGAYTLDFLLEEGVILAPFNGINRYLPYSQAVSSAPKLAYIFPAGNAPAPSGLFEDLKLFLSDKDNQEGEGPARPHIREQLSTQEIVSMQRVADWDVWIVADK
ncbi:MAG TPA: hypothetical protein VI729_08435 [Anaerolineales bacterium]|nr:hypothetical protein [Anaerolineales bacterium]